MSMKKINISIIVPTYNRENILCKTIDSILSECACASSHGIQTELIIVDQTKEHTDINTTNYLRRIILNDNVKYIYLEEANLPKARNYGLSCCRGNIVLFLDDDIILDSNFLMNLYRTYDNKIIDSVVGKITLCAAETGNILLENESFLKKIVKSTLLTFFLKRKPSVIAKSGLILSDFSKNIPSITDGGRGCCMSFKKSVFDVIGNFDDNYYGNALREETDLFVRLKRNNMVVYYNPDVHLFHMMANTGGTRSQANNKYWKTYFDNQTYFFYKNFEASFPRIFVFLFFDICKTIAQGLNPFQMIKNSLNRAKSLVI